MPEPALALALGAAGGALLGTAHLAALALNVALYLGDGPAWRPVALHAGRALLLGAALAGAAQAGAPALLACLAGMTAARIALLGRRA